MLSIGECIFFEYNGTWNKKHAIVGQFLLSTGNKLNHICLIHKIFDKKKAFGQYFVQCLVCKYLVAHIVVQYYMKRLRDFDNPINFSLGGLVTSLARIF